MKVIKLPKTTSKDEILRKKNEAEIWRLFKHPNIVEFIDSFTKETEQDIHFFLIMEYIEELTLKEIIDQQNSKRFFLSQIYSFITQIVNALLYLRHTGIADRDLKAENIKFTKNGWMKLLDFGQAKDQLNSSFRYKS